MTSKTTLPLVLVALTTACASMQPKSGVAPTGEPLSLDTWTSTRKETISEKVGESDHYDADGNYMGTSEQYRDKTVTHSSFHWQPMQGSTPLSDEDFWRIAGDAAKAEKARKYRRNGAAMAVAGGVGLVAGTALALAGPLSGDRFGETQKLGMYVGGGMLASAGGFSFAFGFKRLKLDGHPFGYGEAKAAIEDQPRPTAPPPPLARLPRPAGRSVMLNVVSGRF